MNNFKPALGTENFESFKVSEKSNFFDRTWILDGLSIGAKKSLASFHWKIELAPDTFLTDPAFNLLLTSAKWLMWGLYSTPYAQPPLETTTLTTSFRAKLIHLLRWMVNNGITDFGGLDAFACDEFLTDALDDLTDGSEGELSSEVSDGQIRYRIDVLYMVSRQGPTLRDHGMPYMPDEPFSGKTANDIAVASASVENGCIRPYPDEVALPIMNRAAQYLYEPAEDMLKLMEEIVAIKATGSGKRNKSIAQACKDAAFRFEFSTIAGESTPWTARLDEKPVPAGLTGIPTTTWDGKLGALLTMIKGAALTTLMGDTGMRVSEFSAMDGNADHHTGWPSCVRIARSRDGLYEIFYVDSRGIKVYKGQKLSWPIGGRPVGTDFIPPPVRAIQVLNRLFMPWRTADCPALFLNIPAVRGFASPFATAERATSSLLRTWMKEFVLRSQVLNHLPNSKKTPTGMLDFSGFKSGAWVRTASWRTTFASHILKIDPEAIPQLKQHFKHLSVLMTEEKYIGNDPSFIESLDSARQHATVSFLLGMAGGAPIAGGMAKLVLEGLPEIKRTIADGGEDALRLWVVDKDLRIWFDTHGMCFMNLKPSEARCHRLAGTKAWLRSAPNFSLRTPELCTGCACFAVSSKYLDFWEKRLAANEAFIEDANGALGIGVSVAKRRVQQSQSIINVLRGPGALNAQD
ncbi:MAG: hypothetical protein EON54_03300 [Alcaligenaceae bacterium]|jgi:hypothetical protein|nr:MAG: hypothetical protein EON54_03300 [Alcaligenaceae bacterium]